MDPEPKPDPAGELSPFPDDEAPASWHAVAVDTALDRLGSSRSGLSDDEAARRLARHGPNRLEIAAPVSAWKILGRQLRSLVVGLLFAAGFLALLVGDTIEAISILAVLLVNVSLGFFTELGARRAMEGLKKLQVPRATVRRDGRDRPVEAETLVPGDLIALEAGAAIPADARLVTATDLRVVESALTGESFPVDKKVDPVPDNTPLPERLSMVYRSTLVADGSAVALVTATGAATEVGEISRLVQETEIERTPLEERLDVLGRRLIWITLTIAALVTGLGILRGGSLWLMVETGLALAIAAVPEGLPVVATITLAVGMHRMARRRALLRRLPAVETLGSATVVCTDKTGTLTAGEMTVVRLFVGGRELEVTGSGYDGGDGELQHHGETIDPAEVPGLLDALRVGVLANRAALDTERGLRGDPTEAALLVAGRKAGLDRERLREELPEIAEIPFSSERMLMATFHRSPNEILLCVKGAPGRILDLSTEVLTEEGVVSLDEGGRQKLRMANDAMAAEGLRVLALARRRLPPGSEIGEGAISDLVFLALVGIADPLAEGVADTIRTLHEAGVRTIMLTGDQRATAEAVARDLGILDDADELMEGRELADLDPEALAKRVEAVGAFSRVSPADKLHIVDALHARGEIVAMLGDGVNDAPALKRADIGVAMGRRGTDVAKDAAELVLEDDRFPTVAAAVEEGRVVFDNIRKFVFYLFSCNISEVLVLLVSVLAGLPLPLLPLQILWLNMVTDVFPALALGMEPAEPDVMKRPPRSPDAEILSRGFLLQVGAFGLLLTSVTLAGFLWSTEVRGLSLDRARTIAFMILALTQLFHVLNARSPQAVLFSRRLFQNRWAWAAIAGTVGLQLLVVYQPTLARLFHTVPLDADDWGLVAVASLLPLVAGQGLKMFAGASARAPR